MNSVASTKNRLNDEQINNMVKKAFGLVNIISCKELTEGCCNAAYDIMLDNGIETILKIAPANEENLLSYEVHMMQAEVGAMRLVQEMNQQSADNLLKQPLEIPVAEVYYFDETKSICNSDYFFMEKIDGCSFLSIKDSLDEETAASIHRQIGQTVAAINSIEGSKFGYFGAKEKQGDNWFQVFYQMLTDVLQDAKKVNTIIGPDYDEVLEALQRDSGCFEEVKKPVLVHWDSWEGNIFIKDKKVVGIIDWERALWGEGLMEDRFRKHSIHPEFLKGYGITSFTRAQQRRILWYDTYVYVIMMAEGKYRNYPDDSQYIWIKGLFNQVWNDICK